MTKDEIIDELNGLPEGYISIKTIHGKEYYYLQNRVNGKIVSKYIKEEKVKEINALLVYRKMLLDQLADYSSSGKPLYIPTKNAKDLSGYLMCGDQICASFDTGKMIQIDKKLAPLLIKRTHNLSTFLSIRSIDQSRTNSKLLKQLLNIKETKNDEIAMYCHGATITDNYWFKPKGSKLTYKDIAFDSDFYNELSLTGSISYVPKNKKSSPQLTLTGSYEKSWKLIDSTWWLYKVGTKKEIYSEIFSSEFAKLIDVPTAEYEYDGKYIRTKNFADKYNFEPIYGIAGDDDSYDNVFKVISDNFSEDIVKQYLMIIFFDSVVNNIDRHNENLGIMRDKQTGEIISLAPNFDNNAALISRNINLKTPPDKDGFISFFTYFIDNNICAHNYLKEINFKTISKIDLENINKKINIDVDVDLDEINEYILNRYNYLITYLK